MNEELRTPTLVAARWRKELAGDLLRMAGFVAQGDPLVGPPIYLGEESEATSPYAVVLAIIAPDGVVVHTKGIRFQHDLQRAQDAIRDALDPESVTRREAWEADIAAKQAALDARPFPCERGGHCRERFTTDRGRAAHLRAAVRRGDQDWQHQSSSVPVQVRQRPPLTLAGDGS